jgi:hypothetical protein
MRALWTIVGPLAIGTAMSSLVWTAGRELRHAPVIAAPAPAVFIDRFPALGSKPVRLVEVQAPRIPMPPVPPADAGSRELPHVDFPDQFAGQKNRQSEEDRTFHVFRSGSPCARYHMHRVDYVRHGWRAWRCVH